MGATDGDDRILEVLTKRVDVLQRLGEAPAHKRDLVDELDHSRSTINRAISDLEDVNLVERGDDGFAATSAGRLALDRLGTFHAELDDVVAAEPVLAPLGADAPIDIRAVAGSDALLAVDPTPYRPLERFHDDLVDADAYRALLPALDDPRHIRLLYEHVVTRERPAELIVSPELHRALRREFPRRLAAMAETEEFRLYVGDTPPFAVCLLETGATAPKDATVAVVVFTDSGAVHGVLLNRSTTAASWAAEAYEAVRAEAADRTDVHRPETDGDGGSTHTDGGRTAARQLPAVALERQGFVRLDVSYFRDEPVADPTTAWRAGLTIPEVHTGYAIERTPHDGAGRSRALSDSLLDSLADGTDAIVLGQPGSGKSTICKQVACKWYDDDRGSVLYRESGGGRRFESVSELIATVEDADGHALVVVEDAVRPEAETVFEAIERFAEREDVSVLLDAREGEWSDASTQPDDPASLSVVHVPPLRRRDYERLIEHVERTVDRSVDVPVDRTWQDVLEKTASEEDETTPHGLVLALHGLATYVDPLAEGRTTLEETVADVYRDLSDEDLRLDVCVLAQVLNAAGLVVDRGLLYAVAEPDRFDVVDAALERLEGETLFPDPDGTYRTVHEEWSVTFLTHLLEVEGESDAAERFGEVLSALLALADEPERCERIGSHLLGRWTLTPVVDDPRRWAKETVEAVSTMGRERPKLAPLFDAGVELPSTCSDELPHELDTSIGWMSVGGGYYDRAERAFERLPRDETDHAVERLLGLARVAFERGEYEDAIAHADRCLSLASDEDRPVVRARVRTTLGRSHLRNGDTDRARPHLQAALEEFAAADDRRREATVLDNLGIAATLESDDAGAREYFERSLETSRELGYRRRMANTLNNLGVVCRQQGELDRAREHFERSLEIKRTLGRRQEAATSLNNLGIVARRQGEYDLARDYLDRSLERHREIGYRKGEANSLTILGIVAAHEGEYDRARDSLERALAIRRDTDDRRGEAWCLAELGRVANERGEYDRARDTLERSLEIEEDIDYRQGVARSLRRLGVGASERGEYDVARDYLERSLDVAREVDQPETLSLTHYRLGEAARMRGEYDRADSHFERASAAIRDSVNPFYAARIHLARGRLALDRDDLGRALELASDSHTDFRDLGATHWEGRGQLLLGRVALASESRDTAREHLAAAVETFEAVGAPQDALATLRHLVRSCHELGDVDGVQRWLRRADAALDAASEPVVEQHREWYERFGSDNDVG